MGQTKKLLEKSFLNQIFEDDYITDIQLQKADDEYQYYLHIQSQNLK